MSKHTPGRWHVDGHNTHAVIAGQNESGTWPQYQHVCTCDYGKMDPDRFHELNKANARLIAAAPDMLDMLRKCRSLLLSREIEEIGLDELLNRIDNG